MKITTIAVISLVLFPIAVVIALGSSRTPEQRAADEAARLSKMTTYQRCVETANKSRSEEDAKFVIRNLCDKAAYEPGDYRP